jgi:serine/threonine-protein kinase RsbW
MGVAPVPVDAATRPGAAFVRSRLGLFVLVAVGYGLGSELAFSWFAANGLNATFFPAAGVTLAALLLVPRGRWPIVLAAAGLAELTVDLYHDIAFVPSLGYVTANLAQPLVGALLVQGYTPRLGLDRTRHVAAFLACCCVAAPALGGVIGASSFVWLDGGSSWWDFAVDWLVGDGLGVLVVGSTILALASPAPRLGRMRLAQSVVLGGAAVAGTVAVFQLERIYLAYIPIALLMVIAFRAGTRGVALTGMLVAVFAAEATAEGHVYWETIDVDPGTGLVYLQLALAVVIVTALALAAEIAQRERAAAAWASAQAAGQEAARSAAERTALLEAERSARERAEVLERNASHLAAAAGATDVARSTVDVLAEAGFPFLAVFLEREGRIRTLASAGIRQDTLDRIDGASVTADLAVAEAIRTGATIDFSSGDAYDVQYPGFGDERRQNVLESLVAIPIRDAAERVIGVLFAASPIRGWLDDRRRQILAGVAQQCGLALERALLKDAADVAAADASYLARLSDRLERPTSVEQRARRLVEMLVPERTRFAAVHVAGESPSLLARAGDCPAVVAQFDTTSLADNPVPQELGAGDRLATVLPLRARRRTIGALIVPAAEDADGGLGAELLRQVASRAAVALDNALLYERERAVSHTLQLGLLGGGPARADGTVVAAAYRPGAEALEVGGDWYDAFRLPSGRLALVVGDVVGHGLGAAVAMGQLRGAVRALAQVRGPAGVLEQLDVFVQTLPAGEMATIAFVELDLADGGVRYACAGHPPPLVVSTDGATRYLWEGRSSPLGSVLGRSRREAIDRLDAGETLMLYTDGLVERRTVGLDEQLERLAAVAGEQPADSADTVDRIFDAMLVGEEQEDDACLLMIHRLVSSPGFSYSFPAAPAELRVLRGSLDSWLEGVGADEGSRRSIVLAVSEAAANAVEHAYSSDGQGVVVVEATIHGSREVEVEVRDAGAWRRPVADTARGRGTPIMRATMDEVVVEQGADGTVVRMRRTSRDGAPA